MSIARSATAGRRSPPAIDDLCARADLLIITGGLGPTDDDVTREALGDVFDPGVELVCDEAAREEVESWFAGRGRSMPAGNARQALRPASMAMLSNAHGTAPGLTGDHDGCVVFALPGPPREMKPMFENAIAPEVRERAGGDAIVTKMVHACGIGESAAAELLGAMTNRDREPVVGITASQGVISARIRATGAPSAAHAAAEADAGKIESLWTPVHVRAG